MLSGVLVRTKRVELLGLRRHVIEDGLQRADRAVVGLFSSDFATTKVNYGKINFLDRRQAASRSNTDASDDGSSNLSCVDDINGLSKLILVCPMM